MTSPFDPVLLGLVRRVMPQALAQSIAGVQPMTGPASNVFAMRAPYPFGGCDLSKCQPEIWLSNDFIVDIHSVETRYEKGEEVVTWALLNCRHPFNYYSPEVSMRSSIGPVMAERFRHSKIAMVEPQSVKTWRWMFSDQNDAFAFRMRWT